MTKLTCSWSAPLYKPRTRAWHCSDHGRTSPCTRMQILRCVQESRWSWSSLDMPCSQRSMTSPPRSSTCLVGSRGMRAAPCHPDTCRHRKSRMCRPAREVRIARDRRAGSLLFPSILCRLFSLRQFDPWWRLFPFPDLFHTTSSYPDPGLVAPSQLGKRYNSSPPCL